MEAVKDKFDLGSTALIQKLVKSFELQGNATADFITELDGLVEKWTVSRNEGERRSKLIS